LAEALQRPAGALTGDVEIQRIGRTIANAPSTPHFIIRPDGSFIDLVTGIESPEDIVEQVKSALQG
jgi:hypothetical protein